MEDILEPHCYQIKMTCYDSCNAGMELMNYFGLICTYRDMTGIDLGSADSV